MKLHRDLASESRLEAIASASWETSGGLFEVLRDEGCRKERLSRGGIDGCAKRPQIDTDT